MKFVKQHAWGIVIGIVLYELHSRGKIPGTSGGGGK